MLIETFFYSLTCLPVSGKGAGCAVKRKTPQREQACLLTNFQEAKTEKCIYDDLMSWKELWWCVFI